MARRTLSVSEVYGSDCSDSSSDTDHDFCKSDGTGKRFNGSGDVSDNIEVDDDGISFSEDDLVTGKYTSNSIVNTTPTTVSVNSSVSRRLMSSQTGAENQASIQPLKDLINHRFCSRYRSRTSALCCKYSRANSPRNTKSK